MPYVKCATVEEGLRPSEVSVGVKGVDGVPVYLRVERDFLTDNQYLPVWVVEKKNGKMLVELPHEADSGVNRL